MIVRLVGTTGLFQNAMSAKAQRTLLIGGRKKTAAEKLELKHDPEREFRDAAYLIDDDAAPTLLGFPAAGIKGAMATAALETAGITKSSVQRLVFIPRERCPIYGVPKLRLDVVRSADINRTPDIRSRPYLARWAAEFEVRYVTPQLNAESVLNLLANAGCTVGIGDFRQEKGRGSFGTFRVLGEGQQDDEWDEIVATGDRVAQIAAMEAAEPADADTEQLLAFLEGERARRGHASGPTLVEAAA